MLNKSANVFINTVSILVPPFIAFSTSISKSQAVSEKSTELLNSEFKFDLCYRSLVYLEKFCVSSCPGKSALEVYKLTTILTVAYKREHF